MLMNADHLRYTEIDGHTPPPHLPRQRLEEVAMSGLLRVGSLVPVTHAEGPGARFALWVQGCSIRCAGCCNPHLFDAEAGQPMAVGEVLAQIVEVRDQIEGITLLGGEPFEQAAPLAELARETRALGLSVMTFSGYRLEELLARRSPGTLALLAETDLLVDGRYEASLPETERRWAGSTNQRFHYLSARYSPGIERAGPGEVDRTVEVRLGADGTVAINGWPALVHLARRR